MKTLTSSLLLIASLLAAGLPAAAETPAPAAAAAKKKTPKPMERPRLVKGAKILIQSYDAASDTFTVQITREPGVGPNIATPEALVEGIGLTLGASTFRRKYSEYIGAEFVLTKELPLLFMREVDKRKERRARP